MAEIQVSNGKKRQRKLVVLDMTPMVDLGFLLITFFVLTSRMAEQKCLEIKAPQDQIELGQMIKESSVLNIIADVNQQFYYYFGKQLTELKKINSKQNLFQLVGEHKKQILVFQKQNKLGSGDSAVIMIKPTPKSTLQNIVDLIDAISNKKISNYSIVDADSMELKQIKKLN